MYRPLISHPCIVQDKNICVYIMFVNLPNFSSISTQPGAMVGDEVNTLTLVLGVCLPKSQGKKNQRDLISFCILVILILLPFLFDAIYVIWQFFY